MATVCSLTDFAKAHGATNEKSIEISRNGKFTGIRCIDGTYVNFAKSQFGENPSREVIMAALQSAADLDVIEGISTSGKVCYTIIRRTEISPLEWDAISF